MTVYFYTHHMIFTLLVIHPVFKYIHLKSTTAYVNTVRQAAEKVMFVISSDKASQIL